MLNMMMDDGMRAPNTRFSMGPSFGNTSTGMSGPSSMGAEKPKFDLSKFQNPDVRNQIQQKRNSGYTPSMMLPNERPAPGNRFGITGMQPSMNQFQGGQQPQIDWGRLLPLLQGSGIFGSLLGNVLNRNQNDPRMMGIGQQLQGRFGF